MFSSLLGTRHQVDIHNLTKTVFNLNRILKIFSYLWKNFGFIWIIVGKNSRLFKYLGLSQLSLVEDVVYFWCRRWISGLFTNADAFITASSTVISFPSLIFYLSYSANETHFDEAKTAVILQTGLADSTAVPKNYDYFINTNEKSLKSLFYFLELIILNARRAAYSRKELFLLN